MSDTEHIDAVVAALASLAADKVPVDIQELLTHGNPWARVPPGALARAIKAALRSAGQDK